MPREIRDDSAPLIVDDVSRQFGNVTVLDGVSVTAEAGSIVAIVGPNGSGKTTFLQIVVGLLDPSTGSVERPLETARPIGYLPQHPELRATMTVRETLAFYQSLLDSSPGIDPILETIGLAGVRRRRVEALSGGMRQLLGIGTAILGDPPIIVLDEPTSGLDPRNTEHIFDVIADLAADGTSVVLTTHDLAHAQVADKIVVLSDGQSIIQAAPSELQARTTEDTLVDAFTSILGSDPTVQGTHER